MKLGIYQIASLFPNFLSIEIKRNVFLFPFLFPFSFGFGMVLHGKHQQIPGNRSNRSSSAGSRVGMALIERKIPHTFAVHTYTRPTVCQFCKKLLRGLFKQGVQCKDCQYNAHKKCIDKVPKDCAGEKEPNPSEFNDSSVSSESETYFKDDLDDSDNEESPNNNKQNMTPPVFLNGSMYRDNDNDSAHDDHATADSVHPMPSSANIPLMRIVQSVKHTKRRSGQVMKEGWLVHFTNKDKSVKRHYWRLDSKAIVLFISDHGSKYFKEIPLNEIISIDTARNLSGNESHCFTIRTTNVDYFVGQDPLLSYKVGEPLLIPPADSGVGAHLAKSWEVTIRQAMMPVTNYRKFYFSFKKSSEIHSDSFNFHGF